MNGSGEELDPSARFAGTSPRMTRGGKVMEAAWKTFQS